MFLSLLPDLRRAFTLFIPTEIDRIAELVAEELELVELMDPELEVPPELVALGAEIDARVAEALAEFEPDTVISDPLGT